jgi:cell division control protein 45
MDGEGSNRQSTHIEKFERRLRKNRERRDWEKTRDRVLFNYTQYSYYIRSTALIFFEVAWQMSKDTVDLLWWAIVGITEQLLLGKIESSTYTLESQKIQSHVSRLSNKVNEKTHTSCRILFENDLYLALYRHWSIKESIKNSTYSACKMKLWTLNGKKKLKELMVEMGLPLAQARQQFNSMDLLMKKDFFQMIEKTAEKYNMPGIIYGSFTLQYGYKNKFSAADYVYAMMALTEQIEHERTAECCFLDALECLSRNKKNTLEGGIEKAKVLLNGIFKQVKTSLETQMIFSAGPFLYLVLQDENILFSSPYGLTMLSKFMLNGHIAVSRSRKAKELPLITCIPVDLSREICLLIGIPPVGDDNKNLFGKAFEQAAIKSNAAISQDFFDTNIIQIKQSDCPKFIDALTVLLSS